MRDEISKTNAAGARERRNDMYDLCRARETAPPSLGPLAKVRLADLYFPRLSSRKAAVPYESGVSQL
jgi:hypothetical protein